MTRIFGLFVGLLMLAGCNQVVGAITAANALTGTTVSQRDLDLAVQAYDLAILEPLNAYRYTDAKHTVPRPFCTTAKPLSVTNFCANYDVLARIQPYTQRVENARVDVQACVRTQCSAMSALAATFRAAWADADVIKAQVNSQLRGAQ